jgi:hypothetical protein
MNAKYAATPTTMRQSLQGCRTSFTFTVLRRTENKLDLRLGVEWVATVTLEYQEYILAYNEIHARYPGCDIYSVTD